MMELSRLRDILIACIKKTERTSASEGLGRLTPGDWDELLQLAKTQRVAPLLWHRLKQKGLDGLVPSETSESFRNLFLRNTVCNLRLNGQLHLLLSALADEGIPLILLKGIVLANTVYENVSVREMNDIDVLAHSEHLERIAGILTAQGYQTTMPYSVDVILQTQRHLPRFIKKGQAGFEIHWTLAESGDLQSVNLSELWDRATPVQIAGCNALMLSPEDMLLHLCHHVSYHHGFAFGLRPFCDMAAMIDRYALDWQSITARTEAEGRQRGVYLALCLAVEFADAAVPADVLKHLRPANMPDAVLDAVRDQVFADKALAQDIPTPFAQLLASKRFSEKIQILLKRIFLPRILMANLYAIPADSLKIYACYPLRVWDLLRRHGETFKKHHNSDTAVTTLTDRAKQIADWLD